MTPSLVLTDEEVAHLDEVFRSTDDRRLRDRVQAVLMASRGRSSEQIGLDLAVNGSTVRRWLQRWHQGGLDSLRIRWAPGKPAAIGPKLAPKVIGWVRRGPVASGVDRANWTSAALAEHLAKTTGTEVSERTMRRFCQRHDIRPYRPTYRFLRGDATKQEKARRDLTVLKK